MYWRCVAGPKFAKFHVGEITTNGQLAFGGTMDWKNTLTEIAERYTVGPDRAVGATEHPDEDFQQVAQAAPKPALAAGISQAFRSDQTPPFPHMLATLFERSDPSQRAGVLNRLLGSLGSAGISSLPGLGGLSALLGGGGVTPQQASQISPAQLQQIVTHAEARNPSTVDEVSGFYAHHPQVMQAAGGLALSIAMQHMLANR
jgi:hypothetical protein